MPVEHSKSVRPIKVFLSYSTTNKQLVKGIKDELGKYKLSVFLAHEDIRPSIQWQEEILQALGKCDVFLPVLTKEFKASHWTDQEFGVAIALNKLVFPISVNQKPYGFITRYQTHKFFSPEPQSLAVTLLGVLAADRRFKDRLKPGFLHRWCLAGERTQSRLLTPILQQLSPFSYREMNQILNLAGAPWHADESTTMKIIDEIIIKQKQKYSFIKLDDFLRASGHRLSSPKLARLAREKRENYLYPWKKRAKR